MLLHQRKRLLLSCVVANNKLNKQAAIPAALLLLLSFSLGCGDGTDGSNAVKRVTLTGNYVTSLTGQGWNLEGDRLARDSADADFELTMTMVISLFPNQPQVAFCEQTPLREGEGFKHVEEVPSTVLDCPSWGPAYLGGNSPSISERVGGRGFIVRNRSGVPVAKLMTVSASNIKADVNVTFDIMRL